MDYEGSVIVQFLERYFNAEDDVDHPASTVQASVKEDLPDIYQGADNTNTLILKPIRVAIWDKAPLDESAQPEGWRSATHLQLSYQGINIIGEIKARRHVGRSDRQTGLEYTIVPRG